MINIISRALVFNSISGPAKVVKNLIKGLERIQYPYVLNKRLDACKRLFIHDDRAALEEALKIRDKELHIIAGPNIYMFPRDIPKNMDLSNVVYLNPSPWGKSFWLTFGFGATPLEVWPTGIDTSEFAPYPDKKEYAFVYFKQRFVHELDQIEEILRKKSLPYKVLIYDNGYKEEDYKKLIAKARYIIWLGRQDTQGIAFQEAMACNVPILVCDVPRVGYCKGGEDMTKEEKAFTNTTSAPYFDDTCGIKIKDLSKLESAVEWMEANAPKLRPREFIMNNLSLEKKARDFVDIYDKYFNLSFELGRGELIRFKGSWRNDKFWYVCFLKVKHLIKILLVKLNLWKRIYLLKRRLTHERR